MFVIGEWFERLVAPTDLEASRPEFGLDDLRGDLVSGDLFFPALVAATVVNRLHHDQPSAGLQCVVDMPQNRLMFHKLVVAVPNERRVEGVGLESRIVRPAQHYVDICVHAAFDPCLEALESHRIDVGGSNAAAWRQDPSQLHGVETITRPDVGDPCAGLGLKGFEKPWERLKFSAIVITDLGYRPGYAKNQEG